MVLAEVSQLMGLSLRMSEDQLTRDALAASASAYYCTGGSNGDSPTNLSLSDIQNVVAALLGSDGNMILESQIGEDRFGTAPKVSGRVKSSLIDLEALA
jgi:hypothetical protein